MSKPKMYQFLGSKDSQKANKVEVTYDPSVIRKKTPTETNKEAEADDKAHPGKIGGKLSNMSLSMSMGKDDRKFKLEIAFDRGEVFTVTAAAKLLTVSYGTAKTYAQELGIKLMDDKKGVYLDGRLPKNL